MQRLRDSVQDRAIVNAIIQMAKSLGLKTTAEGIEDEHVRQQLIDLGGDYGQGYLFSGPQTATQFESFMHASFFEEKLAIA